jgi:cytochrome c-type biogenesis protein CcmH/NrfG
VARAFPPADGQVDPEEALAAFREAVRLKPDLVEGWYRLGATLSGLRRYDEAIGALREAVRIKPEYVGAWYQLGVASIFTSRADSQKTLGEALRTLERLDRDEASRLRGLVPYHLRAALFGHRLAARTLSAFRRNHAEPA